MSHLEFMDVEIKQDDLNQKFLTSLAPKWLMYTIVWKNRDDLNTMSLDDVYNHLKVYESEVQKKSESNSQNMAFISSSNTSSGKGEVHTADRLWKKTGKKITIQGSDVAGFDKSKVECFNCHKMGHFAREYRAPRSKDRANEEENHALVADDEVSTEFTLMAKSSSSLENEALNLLQKDLDNLLGSQRSDKNKEGLGYNEVPPLLLKPTPSIDASKCNTSNLQSNNFSVFEHGESSGSIMSKLMIKFVKADDCPRVIKANNIENARKSTVKYAEMYRNTIKSPKVRGNQQNWNNLKSQQLGKDFLMQNKACFKCGHFDHLSSDCGVWVEKGKTWPKNNYAHTNVTSRAVLLKTGKTPIAVSRPNMNVAQPKMTSFVKTAHSNVKRPFQGKSSVKTQPRVPRVSTVIKKILTVDSKFSTDKSTFTTDLGNKGKAVKASACWIWRPKQNTTEQGPNCNCVSVTFKKYQYIDTQGRLKQYTRRAKRIAHSKAFSPAADEPASLSRDDRQGEAFPTVFSLDAGQDRENINKTSSLPHESSPRVTSLDADEGRQRKCRASQEDASITKGIKEIGEEVRADKSTELGSNDTKEMVDVLSLMEAANILTSGVAAASVSSVAGVSVAGVPTVSGSFPTASVIFTTASVVTPYTRRPRGITIGGAQHMMSPIIGAKDKGKQKVVESEVPKKKKLQEHIDAQVAREIEEEFARENQRVSEQLARDSKIARLHAKEELKIMIEGLDRSNEMIAKHLQEYEHDAANLFVGEKIALISELVKYQDHRTKILKYQVQQSKPLSKKEQREFYIVNLPINDRMLHLQGFNI
nr:ribonuclease H-like domain-containing protein [Tanacetum cinerariifolium]